MAGLVPAISLRQYRAFIFEIRDKPGDDIQLGGKRAARSIGALSVHPLIGPTKVGHSA
jgi:hypothetical protein